MKLKSLRFKFITCTLLLVVIAELISRYLVGLGTPAILIEHERIEYMFKPNQDVRVFHNNLHFNQYGMRSRDFSIQKLSPNEVRVLVIGDSVVNGGNQIDQSELSTALLEGALVGQIDTASDVIVGNISAKSWGPGNQLAYVKEFGLFSADYVILVVSSHDYSDVPSFQPLGESHPTETPLLAVLEGVMRYGPRFLPKIFRGSTPPDHEIKATAEQIETATTNFRELIGLARSTGAAVGVIQHLTKTELAKNQPETGYFTLKSICDDLSVPRISTEDEFSSGSGSTDLFLDDIHPSVAGQKKLSATMTKMMNILVTGKSVKTETDSDQSPIAKGPISGPIH